MKRLAAVALLLSGCATQGKYKSKLDGFIGQPADAVIAELGHPDRTEKAYNGNTVLIYDRKRNMVMEGDPQRETASYQRVGNQIQETRTVTPAQPVVVNMDCFTSIELDAANNVLRHSFRGNGCKSR